MPTATPPDQVEAVLAEALARPTLGARQLVSHLADRGVRLSASGVQKLLRRHRLGRRAQRVAALAQLTAATTGILTTPAKDGPFGFCHLAARPGDLVALDSFDVGKLKGIGPVWQLTAVDTATRYAIGRLVAGTSRPGMPPPASTTSPNGWPASGPSSPVMGSPAIWRSWASVTTGSHPAHPTTTRSANASRAPRSRSSTGRPSTASTPLAWPTWAPSSRAGSRPTTLAVATTATSCVAARPLRSCRRTYHDQAKSPPVTSTRAQDSLERGLPKLGSHRHGRDGPAEAPAPQPALRA